MYWTIVLCGGLCASCMRVLEVPVVEVLAKPSIDPQQDGGAFRSDDIDALMVTKPEARELSGPQSDSVFQIHTGNPSRKPTSDIPLAAVDRGNMSFPVFSGTLAFLAALPSSVKDIMRRSSWKSGRAWVASCLRGLLELVMVSPQAKAILALFTIVSALLLGEVFVWGRKKRASKPVKRRNEDVDFFVVRRQNDVVSRGDVEQKF
mmetsp:Transcript_51242/g.136781  ORF Transcript_51242/g.136781 Transcript_51242/m.136781 type:complete len:205 (-) Transcript_51242:134-748(-)